MADLDMISPEDKKAIDEIMKESNLPEAPMSTHIDSYFKGFHVGFTIRGDDNKNIPVVTATNVIESLIAQGYKPSWNEETNGKALPKPIEPVATPKVDESTCKHEVFTLVESHSAKNPGRFFKKCNACGAFIGWN
jgi:hypothetical protein